MSHLAMATDWQDSQEITEYFIDGNGDGERLFVAFEHAPNPEGCGSDAKYTHVDGATKKGKYLFFIILSVHGAKQSVAPKLEACDEPEPPPSYRLKGGVELRDLWRRHRD